MLPSIRVQPVHDVVFKRIDGRSPEPLHASQPIWIDWIVPGAEMEATYFPQADDIIDIVTSDFHPAVKANRRGIRNWDDIELARRAL